MTRKEMFERYEKVRKSGKYNMITNAIQAMKAAGLKPDEYLTVLQHYVEFAKEFKKDGFRKIEVRAN